MFLGVEYETREGQHGPQTVFHVLRFIRHWKVIHGSYLDVEDDEATWFVDPPYQHAGKLYRRGAGDIDFEHLGRWCRSRQGQVMVCEAEGADQLPFEPFREIKANPSVTGGYVSNEVLWTNAEPPRSFLDLIGG